MPAFFCLALFAFVPAASADLCVSCNGPAATYLCIVKKAEEISTFAGDKAIAKICIKVLKASGSHGSCQVAEPKGGQCTGTPRTIGWREVKDALAGKDSDPSPAKTTAPAPPPAAKQPIQDADSKHSSAAPPQPKSLEPTASPAPPDPEPTLGEKIKGSAEKTWHCVSSFFGNC